MQQFVVCAAFLTGRIDHDTPPINGTAGERQRDRAAYRVRRATHYRQVLLAYAPSVGIALDSCVDLCRDRHEDDTRCPFVEARDDPRLEVTVPTGSGLAQMPEEPIEQGSRPVLICRVDDHSRRFVDRDQVLIFIQNREADWLRFGWRAPRSELSAL